MDTYNVGVLDGVVKARVFWEHVIHPQSDVVFHEDTGEIVLTPRLDEKGREILDKTPVEISVPFERPEPLHLRIRRMVLEAMSAKATEEGYETMRDFEDFGEDEDGGFYSPYEHEIDNLPIIDDTATAGMQSQTPSGGDTTTTAAISDGNNGTQTG